MLSFTFAIFDLQINMKQVIMHIQTHIEQVITHARARAQYRIQRSLLTNEISKVQDPLVHSASRRKKGSSRYIRIVPRNICYNASEKKIKNKNFHVTSCWCVV